MSAEMVFALLYGGVALLGLWSWWDGRKRKAAQREARNRFLHFDPAKTAGGRAGKYQATDMYYVTEQDLDEVERRLQA